MPILTLAECEYSFNLDSYPMNSSKQLQPWDAADLYFISDAQLGNHPAILNDQWGALTCFVASKSNNFYSWTDSFCSRQAIKANLQKLQTSNLNATDSARSFILGKGQPCFPENTDSLWIQCPKSFDQLHWWLTLALEQLGPGITIYLAGMAKHIPVKWLNWLEDNNDHYKQFPIKKKARLMRFKLANALPPLKVEKGYLGPDDQEISALPGVFSRDHFDIGSRFFIEQLAKLQCFKGNVVDLGCGNGLLSIAVLYYAKKSQQQGSLNLILCDDSELALVSAENNLAKRDYLSPTLHHTDALYKVTGPIDTVMCNPPFHSGNRISTAAAERMFRQSAQVLAAEGQLLVIANRHLGYAASLKQLFSTVELLASDAKFVCYRCTQPLKQATKFSHKPSNKKAHKNKTRHSGIKHSKKPRRSHV